jgi:hypothetical protein
VRPDPGGHLGSGATSVEAPPAATVPGRPDRLTPRRTALLLLAVTAGGAVLRFAGLGDKSLWIDEAFSVWVSGQPLASLWRTTVDLDFHPPLYYALLHAWLALGDGEVVVRGLSALLSVLTIPVVFLIGARLGGRALGLMSSGAVALSPLQIAYAQQARMYALMTLCAALSLLFLVLLLLPASTGAPSASPAGPGVPTARRARLVWAGFAVSTALAMLSHNTAVLLPLAIGVFLAVAAVRSARRDDGGAGRPPARAGRRGDPFRGLAGAATGLAAAVALWSPWLPHFVAQSRRVDREFWISPPTPAAVLEHWHDLVNAHGPPGAYRGYVLLAVLVLIALGVRHLRAAAGLGVLLLVLVVVPVVAELLVSLRRPIFFTQTLVWTSVPYGILLAAGVLHLRRQSVVATVAAMVVALDLVGIRGHVRDEGMENWREAVRDVAPSIRPDDVVLFSAGWAQIPFDYYYSKLDARAVAKHGLPTDVLESRVLEAKMTNADLARLDDLTTGRSRIWLVRSHDWYTDPAGIVPARLERSFDQVDSRSFTGITVVQYRARTT